VDLRRVRGQVVVPSRHIWLLAAAIVVALMIVASVAVGGRCVTK
jgi:hypothetical protein